MSAANQMMETDEAPPALSLPPRQPDQPKKQRPADTKLVRTNLFPVHFKNQKMVVYRYELKFFVQNERGTKDLSEEVKNPANAESRRQLLGALFGKLRETHTSIFAQAPFYLFDCSRTLISPDRLNVPNEPLDVDPATLDHKARESLPRAVQKLYADLKPVRDDGKVRFDNDALKNAYELEETDLSPLQILSFIYNQGIVESSRFHVFPQKSFLKEAAAGGRYPTAQGRIFKDGIAKGIRLGGNDPQKPDLLLQIDVSKAAFFPDDMRVDQYLMQLFNCRDSRALEKELETDRGRERASKELKGLVLRTTHLEKQRIFRCDGLDTKAAKRREFEVTPKNGDGGGDVEPASKKERRRYNIPEYYEERYKIKSEAKYLPCAIEKTKDRKTGDKMANFYLLDVVVIVPGQRVSLQKMDGAFQQQMIRNACMDPVRFDECMKGLVSEADLTAENPFAKAYGCPIDPKPIEIKAEVLHPPAVQFAVNVKGQFNDGRFNAPPNRRFLTNAPVNGKPWIAVNYDRCMNNRDFEGFVNNVVRFLKDRGTVLAKPDFLEARSLEEITAYAEKKDAQFILFVTNERDGDYLHNAMKHYEMRTGRITQHIRDKNAKKQCGDRPQANTMENIILKTNEKLGGTNFNLATGQGFMNANRPTMPSAPQYIEQLIGNGRMFIGIDVSGTTSADAPTVAAIAYSYNEDLSMTGFYFFEQPRATILRNLGARLERAILAYKERSKRKSWPSHLVIYRGGVSEGEYMRVVAHEVNSISTQLAKFAQAHKCPPIGFTVITAQRHNKFRLIPAQSSSAPQASSSSSGGGRGGFNDSRGSSSFRGGRSDGSGGGGRQPKNDVPPGTVVTKDVTDPTKEQFVLVPHKAFQGIPKPVVYTVVADQSPSKRRIPREDLINMTNALCYHHGGVLQPVSRPSFLYHAGEVAKRGANNRGVHMSQQGVSPDISPEDLTNEMQVRAQTKFWC